MDLMGRLRGNTEYVGDEVLVCLVLVRVGSWLRSTRHATGATVRLSSHCTTSLSVALVSEKLLCEVDDDGEADHRGWQACPAH